MNTERLRELADILEQMPYVEIDPIRNLGWTPDDDKPGFNMETYLCQTAACIAGHAALRYGGEPDLTDDRWVHAIAREVLELGIRDAIDLFNAACSNRARERITPKQAAAALRLVADGRPVRRAWHLATLPEASS